MAPSVELTIVQHGLGSCSEWCGELINSLLNMIGS
jgi:hypothetical protein